MFDLNYSIDSKGKQPAAAASAPLASTSDNTRDVDLHIAPNDHVGVRNVLVPERPNLVHSGNYNPQRTYVRRHHVPRRRQRNPSHHKIQKRPSLTTTPSAPLSSMTTATRTISSTSTASAPASTSALASASTSGDHLKPAWLNEILPEEKMPEIIGPLPQYAPLHLSPNARLIVDRLAYQVQLEEEEEEEEARKKEAQSLVQQQQQEQEQHQKTEEQPQEPLSPPTAMSLVPDTAAANTADLRQSWAGVGSLEVDDGIEMDDAFELDDANIKSLLPPSYSSPSIAPSALNATSSSANVPETRRQRPEKRQLKQIPPTQSRSIQALVEKMIETGTQCNVRSAPPLPSPSAPVLSSLDDLKVDHGYDFASMELEVDERYCDGTVNVLEEERALLESIQVRRATGSGPAGIRKHAVEGTLPLRYQLSAEAAMRCATVVRSRPRMRRRKEHGTGSVISSVAYSTHSSPMAQPVLPAEQLPSQHLPAIPSSSYHTPP